MNLQEFLKKTQKIEELSSGYTFQRIRPRIICKDGVSLSVQASHTHYCTPREDYPPYSDVEVGYPSVRPSEEWGRYFDGTWQAPGAIGYLKRVWGERGMIWHYIKGRRFKWMWKFILSPVDNACNSVYGYIPVELVTAFIDQHGGIDEDKTFAEIQL